MAGSLLDSLRLAFAVVAAAGYGAYKLKLTDRLTHSTRAYRPRPIVPARQIAFEKSLFALSGVDELLLIRATGRLRKMGFQIVGDFTLSGWPGAWFRAFVHDTEPIYALWAQHTARRDPPAHLDFLTLLDDSSFVLTSDSDEPPDRRRPAAAAFFLLPGMLPEELYQRHLAGLREQESRRRQPLTASRADFFDHFRQHLISDGALRSGKPRVDHQNLPPVDAASILKRFDRPRPPVQTETVLTDLIGPREG